MKLFNDDTPYIPRTTLKKLFLAVSILTLSLYIVAMICSLCGNDYFIVKYQNEQLANIEQWFRGHNVYALLTFLFMTIESSIILTFTLGKPIKWYHPLAFYGINVGLSFLIRNSFQMGYTISQIFLIILFICLDKPKLIKFIRFGIGMAVSLGLQGMITVIKAGYFDGVNHILPLSGHFIYSLEYDIALSVLLYTITLFITREKGGNTLWETVQVPGGSSQTSKTLLQQSNVKNLTKTQKNKIRLFYVKMYVIQLGTFLLVMILPFILGKVFEFLILYLAFCVARYILGFKYSLHYKKESLCVTVGVLVFGILTLVVPFFYVVIILAIILGTGLAILLHLSYKYKGFYLFHKRAKPDKFAELSVIMDDDLTPNHVKIICLHRGLDTEQTSIMIDFASGEKKSYLAYKYHYSEKTIERKINECINLLKQKD